MMPCLCSFDTDLQSILPIREGIVTAVALVVTVVSSFLLAMLSPDPQRRHYPSFLLFLFAWKIHVRGYIAGCVQVTSKSRRTANDDGNTTEEEFPARHAINFPNLIFPSKIILSSHYFEKLYSMWYGMVWYHTSTILSPDPQTFSGIRGSFLEIPNK